MATLHASVVFCGEIAEGVIGVLVAEDESGQGARVELQRATTFTEQDRGLGQDTYSLSLDKGPCVYGGVTGWVLTPGRLTLQLSEDASEALDLDTSLTIEFDPRPVVDFEEWLRKVLETAPD